MSTIKNRVEKLRAGARVDKSAQDKLYFDGLSVSERLALDLLGSIIKKLNDEKDLVSVRHENDPNRKFKVEEFVYYGVNDNCQKEFRIRVESENGKAALIVLCYQGSGMDPSGYIKTFSNLVNLDDILEYISKFIALGGEFIEYDRSF